MKIDERTIKALEIKATKYTVNDNGLIVNVYPNGTKTFAIRQQIDGKRFYKMLGKYPNISVNDAKKLYKQYYITREEQVLLVDRFDQLCEAYLDEKAKKIGKGSLSNLKSVINTQLLPYFGPYLVNKITTNMFYKFIKNSNASASVLKRTIMATREIFSLALLLGQIDKNPIPEKITNLILDEETSSHRKAVEISDLSIISCIDDYMLEPYSLALKFAIYSMLRIGEVLKIKYSYIDFENKTISIPPENMKMKRPFILPLTTQLETIISKTGVKNGKIFNFSYHSIYKKFKDTPLKEFDIHGFRATARSWLAENNVRFEVAEMCLAHEEKSAVVRAYNRTTYIEERKGVMQNWNDFLDSKINE